ncbi:hypothetical protein [Halovivax gelatinilyticus]|uniref:hypothetical protein n=1 Tax=Halovivax gelatinilyticus TaxID=2961597 RepID=UPI0020CA49DB|nr:hypothetical protein [Halovivax gelatinilyticus]
MHRRTFGLFATVIVALGTAGCSSFFEDDLPEPSGSLREFFEALFDGDLNTAEELLHPDSPVDLGSVNLDVYESWDIRLDPVTRVDPEHGGNVTDEVQADDARKWFSTGFAIDSPRAHSTVFEMRRVDDEWFVYDEIDGHVDAFTSEPFPDAERDDA